MPTKQTTPTKKNPPAKRVSRKKSTPRAAKGKRGRQSSAFLRWFFSIPSSFFWIGGIAFAGLYLLFVYYFFVSPYSFRWKAMYRESIYPEGYDIRGLDISHYQGDIDWERLRNASINNDPIRFIFIKSTEGESLMDENFNLNFHQAHKNDFIRGTYHFFVPDVDPVKQARFYLRQVHLEPGDLPPVLDVEQIGKCTPEQLRRNVRKWLDVVEKHYGVTPILYTSYKFRLAYLSGEEFARYPYWIAHYYVQELEYKGKWCFWQHTDCGRVQGINGYVDCNIFNGTLQELLELTIKGE